MRKWKILPIIGLVVCAAALSGCTSSPTISDTDKSDINRPQSSVTWCITDDKNKRVCYDPVVTNYGDSALVSLQKLDEREASLTIKTDGNEDAGYFVTGINGLENSATKSWQLYRNGNIAANVVSNVIVSNNDQMDFKYENVR